MSLTKLSSIDNEFKKWLRNQLEEGMNFNKK